MNSFQFQDKILVNREWWNRSGFISKNRELIRVLGPHERELEALEGSSKLIDIFHRVLLLWEISKEKILLDRFLARRERLKEDA